MSLEHRKTPPEGWECLVTLEDVDSESYCEYQTSPSMLWYPAKASSFAVEHMRKTQFKRFMDRLSTTDCAAEMKRLREKGPPLYVEDPNVFPLEPTETHVVKLWFCGEDVEKSALLEGAPAPGPEHQKLWDELNQAADAALVASD